MIAQLTCERAIVLLRVCERCVAAMRAAVARASGGAHQALSKSEVMERFHALHKALESKASWAGFLGVAGAYVGAMAYLTNR